MTRTVILSASTSAAELSAGPVLPVRREPLGWAIGPRIGANYGCSSCFCFWFQLRSQWLRTPQEPDRHAAEHTATKYLQREPDADWDNSVAFFSDDHSAPKRVPVLRRQNCPDCSSKAPAADLDRKIQGLLNPYTGLLAKLHFIPQAMGRSWSHGTVLLPSPHPPQGATGSDPTPVGARRRMVFEAIERHCVAYTPIDREELPVYTLAGASAGTVSASQAFFGYPGTATVIVTGTTGCAAAPVLEQAIQHGWLEVIERDALAKWYTQRRPRKRVAIPAADDAWALDLTSNPAVSIAVALSAKPDGSEVYMGAAAGLSWDNALTRAYNEMRQFQLWDRITGPPPSRQAWMQRNTLDHSPWLAGSVNAPSLPTTPLPTNACWANLTRAWLRIPVVRVFCPEMHDIDNLDLPL